MLFVYEPNNKKSCYFFLAPNARRKREQNERQWADIKRSAFDGRSKPFSMIRNIGIVVFCSALRFSDGVFDACSAGSHFHEGVWAHGVLSEDCLAVHFAENEKLNARLGSVRVSAYPDKGYLSLNISFIDVKWTEALLRLSRVGDAGESVCRKYSVDFGNPAGEAQDSCLAIDRAGSYVLDFKADFNADTLYKKITFRTPPAASFDDRLPLAERAIFSSIDCSSNYRIVLEIQRLPRSYRVTYYKVEVFRENGDRALLLDVRMLPAAGDERVSFEYITYNDEGVYFFAVSAIGDACPEDACTKTESARVHVKRKYPPLVIGIVGASFLIPFVLFVIHVWTRRNRSAEESEGRHRDKLYVVCSQTPQKHYLVVKSLEKVLKSLTGVQMVKEVGQATHVLYVCGAHVPEPDPSVYKYLVTELSRGVVLLDVFVVLFPYSARDTPPYLKNCPRFELMEDFGKFVQIFNCEAEDVSADPHYAELVRNVKIAQVQAEPAKISLNMPVIIITEQSDGSDAEVDDGLL
ncbi:uncharacterized protein LOC132699657 [Cylas formicarius]|uniref:uncharacterized protein LOC132699657 n=1 Tax=Cylas formicarius TaxID=197179 RepID=UPI0029587456|nr:uncharacterized protein LOC132699657 [Cylas formicarius]